MMSPEFSNTVERSGGTERVGRSWRKTCLHCGKHLPASKVLRANRWNRYEIQCDACNRSLRVAHSLFWNIACIPWPFVLWWVVRWNGLEDVPSLYRHLVGPMGPLLVFAIVLFIMLAWVGFCIRAYAAIQLWTGDSHLGDTHSETKKRLVMK